MINYLLISGIIIGTCFGVVVGICIAYLRYDWLWKNDVVKIKQYLTNQKIRYECINFAIHTGYCCDTCWNHHPEAKKGECFFGTTRCTELLNEELVRCSQIRI
jgi:hypothetical protein